MTPDEPAASCAADELRGVRRIFLVALAAALIAAGVALGIELSSHRPERLSGPAHVLPRTFQQTGFVDHPVHRVQTADFGAGSRRGTLRYLSTGKPLYVVASCDSGRIQVVTGSLTSAQACTGKAVGVVALSRGAGAVTFTVTVSEAQKSRWAVGIYRA
jgi:hypothetical protein